MGRIFLSELLKLRKSPIWLLILVSPALSTLVGYGNPIGGIDDPWIAALGSMVMLHGWLFLPLMTGIFSAFVCRYEHIGGGWKQLVALPVSRTGVYFVKFGLVMLLVALSQLLLWGGLLLIGFCQGFTDPIPWEIIARSMLGGWVACLPLAALQMAVSVAWASFAAPMAVNVIFTLPNMLVVQSKDYGPYYPWSQPLLAMMPFSNDSHSAFNVSFQTLTFVIMGSFLLFLASGLLYFNRKAI